MTENELLLQDRLPKGNCNLCLKITKNFDGFGTPILAIREWNESQNKAKSSLIHYWRPQTDEEICSVLSLENGVYSFSLEYNDKMDTYEVINYEMKG